MTKYYIIYEVTETGYSAYIPDLPGCIATGDTLHEVELNIKDAMEFHLEGLQLDGLALPHPNIIHIDSVSI
jgi:predicted RNase H-like HicB family nuclease